MAILEISGWHMGGYEHSSRGPIGRAKTMGLCLWYSIQRGRVSWKVKPVDVDFLVDQWCEAVVGMCQAHTKDEFDMHDYRADELLGPIMHAPIKQVREFYQKLTHKLETTPGVPFVVHQAFTRWGTLSIANAKDDGVKRLKTALAKEIADLVEMDVRDQIPEAIARALRWRDPKTLAEIKTVLKSGAKPKLVGRQSCLFLRIGRGKKAREVML